MGSHPKRAIIMPFSCTHPPHLQLESACGNCILPERKQAYILQGSLFWRTVFQKCDPTLGIPCKTAIAEHCPLASTKWYKCSRPCSAAKNNMKSLYTGIAASCTRAFATVMQQYYQVAEITQFKFKKQLAQLLCAFFHPRQEMNPFHSS